jgi:hypothetical protein
VIRSGIGRVKDAVMELSDQIVSSLPLRGTLVRRNFERGLINIGYGDGLAPGDEFLVFKAGDLRLYTEDSIYDYSEEDVIGRARVARTDFLVSEIVIDHVGFFDRVSRGDIVIPAPEPAEDGVESGGPESAAGPVPDDRGTLVGELYDRIRGIR